MRITHFIGCISMCGAYMAFSALCGGANCNALPVHVFTLHGRYVYHMRKDNFTKIGQDCYEEKGIYM